MSSPTAFPSEVPLAPPLGNVPDICWGQPGRERARTTTRRALERFCLPAGEAAQLAPWRAFGHPSFFWKFHNRVLM